MRLLAVFVGLSLNAEGSKTSCAAVPEILVQLKTSQCCASPLKATIAFLEGSTPTTGACGTYLASQRFERFREWITLMGGYVSPKISFQRGHFVDSVSGKARVGYGGIFLNAYEYLHQNELLFVIPDEAKFSESMIEKHVPRLKRFLMNGKDREWLSLGLAVLLNHKREVVGPWQALLPDMREHPLFWPERDIELFRGTQAERMIGATRSTVDRVCEAGSDLLAQFSLTCENLKEAFAIVTSRGFQFASERNIGEQTTWIPFGFDLLNHSPTAVPILSRVSAQGGSSATTFQLARFVLSESRELYNNYGQQSLPGSFASYGFNQPDEFDELFIVATGDAEFAGRRFEPVGLAAHSCPAGIGIMDLVNPTKVCHAIYEHWQRHVESRLGHVRAIEKDLVALSHHRGDFFCSTPYGSLVWRFVESQLRRNNVTVEDLGVIFSLNGPVGEEPELPFERALPLALCSLPSHASLETLERFIRAASLCPKRKPKQTSGYPVTPFVRSLARQGLFNTCAAHEFETLGGIDRSLRQWLAFRNLRIKQQYPDTHVYDISEEIEFESSERFLKVLEMSVDRKDVVYSDAGGLLDQTMRMSTKISRNRVFRLEEIFRYKMQSAYMVMMQCRQPLEAILSRSKAQ